MAKKQGGPIVKKQREVLISQLTELFNDGSIKYYSIRDLSQKFNIAKDTVSKYLNEIALTIDPKDLNHIQLRFRELFENAIETCEKLLERSQEDANTLGYSSSDFNKEVRENIKLLMITIKDYTDYMERFFIKEKVTDKIEIEGNVKTINTQINYFQNNNILTHIESSLEGVVDERQKQQIIVDIMEKSKNETTTE